MFVVVATSCRSWLDLAKPDLWVSIALVSASKLAILSAVAWSSPAYVSIGNLYSEEAGGSDRGGAESGLTTALATPKVLGVIKDSEEEWST